MPAHLEALQNDITRLAAGPELPAECRALRGCPAGQARMGLAQAAGGASCLGPEALSAYPRALRA